MNEHTPGPWEVGAESYEWHSPSNPRRDVIARAGTNSYRVIARAYYPTTTGNTVGAAERQANARLIAAAPDLLALAQQCASECAECEGTGEHQVATDRIDGDTIPVMEPCPDCADIRAVIEKATAPKGEHSQ